MRKIAFFDNKSGAARTSLVYHVAHMLADMGLRVLLLDLDPQSNLTAMLSGAWSRALDRDEAAFRALSALHRAAQLAGERHAADVILSDIGPNLGAINRTALLAADLVVTPLAPDLFSVQGLRNLGPTLAGWRTGWQERLLKCPDPSLPLPAGHMQPLGYVLMQAGMRLSRPIKAYARWVSRLPGEYHRATLREDVAPVSADEDPWCLGVVRHYQSLVPLAQDAQKPMFHLRPGDGAIGTQMEAVLRCREDFQRLSEAIVARAGELSGAGASPSAGT